MLLKIKMLGIDASGKPAVFLNKQDADDLGITSSARVQVSSKGITVTAIALGFEPHEPGITNRKPRNPKESVFFGTKKWLVGVSIILATVAISLFVYILETNGGMESEYAVSKARTMLFGTVVFFELFFVLSCRSFKHNMASLGLLSNRLLVYSLIGELALITFIMNFPIMQEIFDIVPLGLSDWILLLSLATIGFAYSEMTKIIPKLRSRYRKYEQTV